MTLEIAPEILWAQNDENVFLTVNVPDLKDIILTVKDKTFDFSGVSGDKHYSLQFEFYSGVSVTKQLETQRNIFVTLSKEEQKWWPTLVAVKGKKPHWLKTDFSRWQDEDESEGEAPAALGEGQGDFDMAQMMAQMQAQGYGQGSMDQEDSDNEEEDDSTKE